MVAVENSFQPTSCADSRGRGGFNAKQQRLFHKNGKSVLPESKQKQKVIIFHAKE